MDIFTNFSWYVWVILPLLIFLARIVDVSLGTLRVIFITRGYKYFATVLGFFEVLIWIMAITQIMKNITSIGYYLIYAAGFATGTYVGMWLEERISIGIVSVRIIARRNPQRLIKALKSENCRVTVVDAKGTKGPVKVIYTFVHKNDLSDVVKTIKSITPRIFYSIEDLRFVSEGILPLRKGSRNKYLRLFTPHRKGK
ncbi:DUF2179 domain-containing protein [candidate division KSB1 bacterium]